MNEIVEDVEQVAYCGLYCGACRAFLKGRCPGCHAKKNASWCKVRSCCREWQALSCADCQEHDDVKDCKKFNNFIAKIFGWLFNSDRHACICQIKDKGILGHASIMTVKKCQSLKRKN